MSPFNNQFRHYGLPGKSKHLIHSFKIQILSISSLGWRYTLKLESFPERTSCLQKPQTSLKVLTNEIKPQWLFRLLLPNNSEDVDVFVEVGL